MSTIAAILTMAIAIGATASVFGLVDGVLLKVFPYRALDRVLTIGKDRPEYIHVGRGDAVASAPNYLDWRTQNRVFTSVVLESIHSYFNQTELVRETREVA